MASTLERVAAWATGLRPADLPPDVRRRAALHHLSTAGAMRAARLDDASDALLGAPDPGPAALADAAARVVARGYDDFGFFGHPSAGVAPAAWAAASGRTYDDVLCATAVGLEVAARVGAWMLLQPDPGEARAWTAAVGAAVATAKLRGLDADGLAAALSIAIARPRQLSGPERRSVPARAGLFAAAVAGGVDAVGLAERGDTGDPMILDYGDGLPNVTAWQPLPEAFLHLGEVWLSRALVFRLQPVAPYALTAVQGFHEILRRHVKAAGKRLRVDQVERVEVRLDHLAWMRTRPTPRPDRLPDAGALPYAIPHAIGALVATHEDGPALYDDTLLVRHEADVLAVAGRVEVGADAGLTVTRVRGILRSLAPLFAGVPLGRRLAIVREVAAGALGDGAALSLGDVRALVAARAHELVVALAERPSAPLRDVGLHVPQPVSLRLYTTRGGWWPERRDVIEGGPEYAVHELERDVIAKYARCCAWRDGAADTDAITRAEARARRVVDGDVGGGSDLVALLGGA